MHSFIYSFGLVLGSTLPRDHGFLNSPVTPARFDGYSRWTRGGVCSFVFSFVAKSKQPFAAKCFLEVRG